MRNLQKLTRICAAGKIKLSRDFLRSFLERINIYRCVFRKKQVHLTGEAVAQQWI